MIINLIDVQHIQAPIEYPTRGIEPPSRRVLHKMVTEARMYISGLNIQNLNPNQLSI